MLDTLTGMKSDKGDRTYCALSRAGLSASPILPPCGPAVMAVLNSRRNVLPLPGAVDKVPAQLDGIDAEQGSKRKYDVFLRPPFQRHVCFLISCERRCDVNCQSTLRCDRSPVFWHRRGAQCMRRPRAGVNPISDYNYHLLYLRWAPWKRCFLALGLSRMSCLSLPRNVAASVWFDVHRMQHLRAQ